ncbi:hypothetical protein ABZ924_01965 [Streptomyces sp. NPDC046876]|uniref:hypothetical protein n=1 Tax=Streptomyces sp. NPDC046876 TaxID=3155616 RepID=UPI0033F476F6
MIHTFTLVDPWPGYGRADRSLPEAFTALAAAPPEGCTYDPLVWGQYPGLKCGIEAPTRFEAVARVAGTVFREHGILLYDLGVEKLYEWSADDPSDPERSGEQGNTWGRDIAAQLVLTGLDRMLKLGYTPAEARHFVDRALGGR